MRRVFYKDEENPYDYVEKSTSSVYRDEQKIPEETTGDYFSDLNTGTRRIVSGQSDSFSLGGTTLVVETVADLQSAINNFVPTDGGVLTLKPGVYKVRTPLKGLTGLKIIGESSRNTIIDFDSTANNLSFTGTDMYTTGTVSALAVDKITVTGNGTSWLSITNPTTKQLFLDNKWYRIGAVVNDTTLVLSEGVTDTLTYPLNYKIGVPMEAINIQDVTIKGSLDTALKFTDCRDIELKNVIVQGSAKGMTLDNCFIISTKKVFSYSNAGNAFEFTNCAFSSFEDMLAIGNGGNGFTYNNCKTMPLYSCAAISNVGDGINFTDTSDVYLEMELTSNGGQGAELISGNSTILFRQCAVRNNVSDGIKLTATSDDCGIIGCNIDGNGAYGINIANANCDRTIVSSNILDSNTTANGIDNGTGTVRRGNVGWDDNFTSSLVSIYSLVASDTLLDSADTERNNDPSLVWVKRKDITVRVGGTLRVKFSLKSNNGFTQYGKIYVNDVAVGTERTTSSQVYVEFSEDINVSAEDEVQLYTRAADVGAQGAGKNNNFRLYGTLTTLDTTTVNTN